MQSKGGCTQCTFSYGSCLILYVFGQFCMVFALKNYLYENYHSLEYLLVVP